MQQIVYFSRNKIIKPAEEMLWEIDKILETSQTNNERDQVTGALIFNRGVFGQVLEGPNALVEETFERIQMDTRHWDVTVLEARAISERSFGNWSMGFFGADTASADVFQDVAKSTDFNIDTFSGNDIFELLRGLSLRNELGDRAA